MDSRKKKIILNWLDTAIVVWIVVEFDMNGRTHAANSKIVAIMEHSKTNNGQYDGAHQ